MGLKVQKELNKQASDFVEYTFNNLVDTAIQYKNDFAYEGHFSRNESWAIPERFKTNLLTTKVSPILYVMDFRETQVMGSSVWVF